jgi:hypothetical protein
MTGVAIFQMVLSLHLYPNLLPYQSATQAGKYIKQENPEHVYWHDHYGYGLDYYSDRVIPQAIGKDVELMPVGSWVYVTEAGLSAMPPHRVIRQLDDFRVANLNFAFVNPQTRHTKLKKMFLIELTGTEQDRQTQ